MMMVSRVTGLPHQIVLAAKGSLLSAYYVGSLLG